MSKYEEPVFADSPDVLRKRLRKAFKPKHHRLIEPLVALGREGARLTPSCGPVVTGDSRLGGRPDLPPGYDWPHWKRKPLAFIAQINLEQMPASLLEPGVPPTGVLAFFALIDKANGYGGVFEYGTQARVEYFQSADELGPAEFPDGIKKQARLRPQPVTAAVDWTPAGQESDEILGGDFWNVYDRYVDTLGERDYDEVVHRFLGHAEEIQSNLGDDALAAVGKAWPKRKRHVEAPWRLLLQVSSDSDGLGIDFGDLGRLYWMIREDDLAAGRFENAVAVMQCS